MKSICFFSSYFKGNEIPYYIKFYLEELSVHFSETVFITTEKDLLPTDKSFLEKKNIQLMLVKNEGYDFGMWYKAFEKYKTDTYDYIGLVNDSCVLFKKLDFVFDYFNKEKPDYFGLTDTYLLDYHVQSYFLLIGKKAIPFLKEYFSKNGIIHQLDNVIKTYEIGLSQFMIKQGMNVKALYSYTRENGQYNPTLLNAKSLIEQGYPLVKKRIISREYGAIKWRSMVANGFDANPENYIKLIKKETNFPYIDNIFSSVISPKGIWQELLFNINEALGRMYYIVKNKK
jgi:hypothetical protein